MSSNAPGAALDVSYDSQLMQDYLQSAGILVNQNPTSISAFQNTDGQTEAVVIGDDGQLYHVYREPLSDSGWSSYGLGAGFQSIGAVDGTTIWGIGNNGRFWENNAGRWGMIPADLPSGRNAAALSAGADGSIWTIDQDHCLYIKGAAVTQSGVQTPPAFSNSIAPSVHLDASGALHYFCIDDNGLLWTIQQTTPGGAWGRWSSFSVSPSMPKLTAVSVAANQNGALQVFAIDANGSLNCLYQTTPNGPWSGWVSLSSDNKTISALAVKLASDGLLHVFAIGQDDALWHISQTAPNNGWSSWSSLGTPQSGFVRSSLTVEENEDGRLEAFLLVSSLYPYHIYQTTPGGPWSAWAGFPPVPVARLVALSDLTVARNADGHLELFLLAENNIAMQQVLHIWQQAPNGAWAGEWANLQDGEFADASLIVGTNRNGALDVLVSHNGALFHCYEQVPNGSWSGWSSLGSPASPLQTMTVVCDASGKLELFTTAENQSAALIAQGQGGNNGWTSWVSNWWTWYPVAAAPALVTPPTGTSRSCWAVGTDGKIYSSDGKNWTAISLPDSQTAQFASLDQDGSLWVFSGSGELFRYNNGSFQPMQGNLPGVNSFSANSATNIWATASSDGNEYKLYRYAQLQWNAVEAPRMEWWNSYPSVSVASNGAVWILDGTVGVVWRCTLSPARWSWIPNALPTGANEVAFLSAATSGAAWMVDQSGGVWWFGRSWKQDAQTLPENAVVREISSGSGGTLWCIDTAGMAYQKTKTGWQAAAGLPGPLKHAPGRWAVTENGAVYQYRNGNWTVFSPKPPAARAVSGADDGSAWLLDDNGELWQLASGGFEKFPNAPAGIQQIATMDSEHGWAITGQSGQTALYLYQNGLWNQIGQGAPALEGGQSVLLSSAGDGTVWLADADGVPLRLSWTPQQESLSTQAANLNLQSIAAANVSPSNYASSRAHAAWAVSGDGVVWRNQGSTWTNAELPLPSAAIPAQISSTADGAVWVLDTEGKLYRKAAWAAPGQAPTTAFGLNPVAARDQSGRLQVCCINASSQVWVLAEATPNSCYGGWIQLKAPLQNVSGVLMSKKPDGSLRIFAYGALSAGVVYGVCVAEQDASAPGGWGSFTSIAGSGLPSDSQMITYAIGQTTGGDSFVLAIMQTGQQAQTAIFQSWQPASGGNWSEWTALASLPNGLTSTSVVTANGPDGALYCFATTASEPFVMSNRNSSPIGWTSWQSIGLPGGGVPQIPWLVSGNDWGNGGAEVFAIADDSDGNAAVYHSWQDANATTGWSAWAPLGAPDGAAIDSLATGNDASTKELFLIAHSQDGALHQLWPQQSSITGWGDWQPVTSEGSNGAPFDAFAIGADLTGTAPAIFAVSSGVLWTSRRQQQAATGWSNWHPLNGQQYWQPVSSSPAFAQPPCGDGQHLWALNPEGMIYQSANGGSQWTTVAFPDSGSPRAAASVSAGTDGTIWATTKPSSNGASSCYRLGDGGWIAVGIDFLAQAPVGTHTQLWATSTDARANVFRSNDGDASWWNDTKVSARIKQISACADGSVWLIDANGNPLLCQAWQRIMQPVQMPGFSVPAGCREVAAGQNQYGDRYVFCIDNSGKLSYSCEVTHHAWTVPSTIDTSMALSRLGLTRQQDTNELIAYAVGGAVMVIARQSPQRYAPYRAITPFVTVDGVYNTISDLEVIAIDASHWYCFGLIDGTLAGAEVDPFTLSEKVPFSFIVEASNLSQIVRLPWKRKNPNPAMAAIDGSGVLQAIDVTTQYGAPYSANVTPLTGTLWPNGAASVCAALQANSMGPSQKRFYASGPVSGSSGSLWVIRCINEQLQISSTDAWSSWIPLGGDQIALATGPCFAATDTVFTFGTGTLSLTALSQNKTTGKWTIGEVKRPSQSGDEIETVPMYYTDVTVANSVGVPQPQVPVNITSETPVLAVIEGTAFELDPVRGVTCKTNSSGKLIIRTLADSLHTPALTATVLSSDENTGALKNSTTATTIQPSGHVYNFMGGTETLPVGGGQQASFTKDTLEAFKPGISDDTATSVVTNVASLCKLPGSGNEEGGPAGFAFDSTDPDRPQFHVFWTKEELAAYTEQHRQKLAAGLVGGFWSDVWHGVKHAAEDVVDGIKKGVTSVEHFVVDAANKTISFTLKVAGEIVTTFDMFVNTIKDAVLAIEAIVATLVADIEAIIKWLMLLLDWENIIATQRALAGYINQLIETASSGIGSLSDKVTALFNQWAGQFEDFMSQIIGNFDGPVSNLPQNWPKSSPALAVRGTRGLLGASASLPGGGSSGQVGWMVHKVLHYLTPSLNLGSIAALDPSEFLDAFGGQNIIVQFGDAFTAFWQGLIDIFKDPAQFVDLSVATFLTVSEHLVLAFLDFIEDLIVSLLAMVQAILNGIDGMFNHSPHIPFISSLYRLITGEDLTMLGLGTLVIAVPFCILHRLVFNRNPFSESATIEARVAAAGAESPALAAQDIWASQPVLSSAATTSLGSGPSRWQDAYLMLGVVNWFFGLIHDTATCFSGEEAQSAGNMMSFLSDIVQTGLLVCSWPDPRGFPFISWSNDPVYDAAWLNWGSYSVIPAYDLAALSLGDELSDYEPVFQTTMGISALIFGTMTGAIGYAGGSVNIEGLTEDLVGPWGPIVQFTLLPSLRSAILESTLVDPAWVVLGFDLVLNMAVPSLNMAT